MGSQIGFIKNALDTSCFEFHKKKEINLDSTMISSELYSNNDRKISMDFTFEKNESIYPEIRNYTFVKELGKGGFGKVNLYKEIKNPNNLVAVKEFFGINETNFPKEYKKEKKLLSEIHHKYIVKYLFSCFDNNNFYIGMEYCENKDLNNLINKTKNKNQKIEEKFIWKVAYQTLQALEYLHIVKTGNITPIFKYKFF